jgi:hypothetical protein
MPLGQRGGGTLLAQRVVDWPRFPFRAVMVDSARHFLPVPLLEAHIDALAYAKMNRMHWHLTDSCAFPYASARFPNLSAGLDEGLLQFSLPIFIYMENPYSENELYRKMADRPRMPTGRRGLRRRARLQPGGRGAPGGVRPAAGGGHRAGVRLAGPL